MSKENKFIVVPQVTLPNGVTVPSFQVGQYLCSQDADGKAAATVAGKPWVEINFHDAKKACEEAGLKLIAELQCLAIAHDIASQDINWTGGKAGEGKLSQGLHKWTAEEAQAGDFVSPDEQERRWFQLSNGERVYDFSGNAYSWVFDDVQGDEQGLVAKPFTEDSPSIATAPYPSMEKGMGWRPKAGSDWSGYALVRGGCWGGEDDAGVFNLSYDWPDGRYDDVGFRCTK